MRRGQLGRPQLLLLAISGALLLVAGLLAAQVARRVAAAPPVIRGVVQPAPAPPSDGAAAVYAWGDSTMHGDVFSPILTIPRVVAWALGDVVPRVHVQNLARPGASLSEWRSSGLAQVLAEPRRFRPRAVLLYIGHNGYPDAMAPAVTQQARDHLTQVAEQRFARTLRDLVTRIHGAGATPIIALPTSNTEGHPPPGPLHLTSVSAADRGAYEREVSAADQAMLAGDPTAALAAATRAHDLSPGHAWAVFLQAMALRDLRQDDAARRAFAQAHALDLDRQRTLPGRQRTIQALCDAGSARCVDASGALRGEFPWLDDTAFIDLHHPDARSHLLLGHAFARVLADELNISAIRALPPPERWPLHLDPAPMMRVRYLQTFSWYLQLAQKHRRGYPRAFRDAMARGRRCLDALKPLIRQLDDRTAQVVRQRVAVAELLAAAVEGDKADAARRMAALWRSDRSDWGSRPKTHPLPRVWMRELVRDLLGDAALSPPKLQ